MTNTSLEPIYLFLCSDMEVCRAANLIIRSPLKSCVFLKLFIMEKTKHTELKKLNGPPHAITHPQKCQQSVMLPFSFHLLCSQFFVGDSLEYIEILGYLGGSLS